MRGRAPFGFAQGRQDDYPHRIVVLQVVQSLNKKEFLLSEVYAHADKAENRKSKFENGDVHRQECLCYSGGGYRLV